MTRKSDPILFVGGSPSFIFDVSSALALVDARVTGVDRVVLDTAQALALDAHEGVAFTAFDPALGCFVEITSERILEVAHAVGQAQDTTDPVRNIGSVALPPSTARTAQRQTHWVRTRRQLRKSVSLSLRASRELIKVASEVRRDVSAFRARRRVDCHSSMWGPTSTYCSLGIDYGGQSLPHLARRKSDRGFRVLTTVYDLIPIVAPQFATIDLTPYFKSLIGVSDHLLTISDHTAADLHSFIDQHHLKPVPVHKVPVGSSLRDVAPTRPAGLTDAALSGGFVLMVGTVTLRKNHHLVLDAWQLMMRDHDSGELPHLVIVGRVGTLSDETMSRIRHENETSGIVVHLAEASDSELAWLYTNCLFTVFPSLYEGWGLPVSESYDFDKCAITSDRTSIPEAGEGLAIQIDPLDRTAWATAIHSCFSQRDRLGHLEQQIRLRHRVVTPRDTAEAVRRITLEGL